MSKPTGSGRPKTKKESVAGTHPHLIKLFHPAWNGEATLEDFKRGSSKPVFWKCIKGHAWIVNINGMTRIKTSSKTMGCPMCDGKRASKENNLASTHPEIAKQWCYELNGDFRPEDFSYGSSKKVAWICSDNPNHIWPSTPAARCRRDKETGFFMGSGCHLCKPMSSRPEMLLLAETEYVFGRSNVVHHAVREKQEVDILLHEKYVVEFNGAKWHAKIVKRDADKLSILEDAGFTVIRILGEGLTISRTLDIPITRHQEITTSPEIVFKLFDCLHKFFPNKGKLTDYCKQRKLKNTRRYEELLKVINLPKRGESLAEKQPKVLPFWNDERNHKTPDKIPFRTHDQIHLKCPECNHEWSPSACNVSRSGFTGCPLCDDGKNVEYVFWNLTEDVIVECSQIKLLKAYPELEASSISGICRTSRKEHKRWFCFGKKKDRVGMGISELKKEASQYVLDIGKGVEYIFYNPAKGFVTGTQTHLVNHYGISKDNLPRICEYSDATHFVQGGWFCAGLAGGVDPNFLDTFKEKAHETLANVVEGVSHVFYRPKSDELFIGTQAKLISKYKLTQGNLTKVVRGLRKQHKGWHYLGREDRLNNKEIVELRANLRMTND